MKKNQTKKQYKEWLEEIAKEKRNNPNHSEQAFIDMLDYFDIKYTFEKPIIYNHKDGYNGYIFDFYILIDDNEFDIEIDGISHTDEDSKLKDQKRDALAKDCNIEVIRMDSYFVLYLRNIFEDEFTKESFLKWIINGCPISFKKDMSEYKEKYEDTKKELDETLTKYDKVLTKYIETMDVCNNKMQTNKELQLENKKLNEQVYEMMQASNEIQASNEKIQALIKKRNDDTEAENIMKAILAKHKNTSKAKDSSTSSNNSSTVETSNKQEDEELPF